MNGQYMGEQLSVSRVIMIKTGAYQDQITRPYQATVLNGNNLELFHQQTQGGTVVTPTSIATIAGQLIEPVAMSNQVAQIAGGWSNERIRFFLEAKYTSPAGNTKTFIVQGYSDRPGYSSNGHVDPTLILYINNVTVLQEQGFIDPATNLPARRLIDTSQVLHRAPNYNYQGFTPQPSQMQMQTMLPYEIVRHIGIQDMENYVGRDVMDFRGSFNESPMVKSKRTNSLASRYLSSTVNAMTQSLSGGSDATSGMLEVTNTAAQLVPESPIAMDNFINTIEQRTPFKENGYISWYDLTAVFPSIDSVTSIIDRSFQNALLSKNNNAQVGAMTSMAGDSSMMDIRNLESWSSATREAVVATTLSHAVPAVLMENHISMLEFSVTNQTMDGQPQFTIFQDAMGRPKYDTFIDGMDMTRYLQKFHMTLINELMANLSYGNQHSYNIIMRTSVLSDTYINISLNGGIPHEFLMPSFCDALVAPVVTFNPHDKDTLAAGVSQIVGSVQTTPVRPQGFNQYNPMY